MVQPTKPPISVRLGEARLARVDDYAKRHKLTRHGAVMALIDAGLLADGPSLPTPEVQAAIKAEAVRREGGAGKPAEPKPFKSRLKGEWKAP